MSDDRDFRARDDSAGAAGESAGAVVDSAGAVGERNEPPQTNGASRTAEPRRASEPAQTAEPRQANEPPRRHGAAQPGLRELLAWLTSITRPVHGPLYASTLLRIVHLSADATMFALATGGVAAVLTGQGRAGPVLGWLVVLALLKAVSYYGEQLTGHYVAFKALELLRTMAFSRLWPKAPAIVARTRSGDILASITRDVDRIEVVYAHTFAPVVSAVVVPAVFLLAAGWAVGWSVVAIPAACLALALFAVPFLGLRRSFRATRRTLERRRDLAHHVSDSVFGAEEVVSYGRQAERIREMDELGEQVARASRTAAVGVGIRRAGLLLLTLIAVGGVVWSGRNAGLSVALTAALAAGTLRLFEGPRGVEGAAGYLDHSLAAARRLWQVCHEAEAVTDGPEAYEPAGAPSIEFAGVSYAYPEGEFALKDVSFTAPAGGWTVLVGPSGSGKTTAAKLLARYDDPQSGHILLDGVPVQQYTLASLRSAVVAVPQKIELLNSTIGENLALGRPQASQEEMWQALETACLAGEVRSMPDGLDTAVGQAGERLSGGQAARLCLARALVMRPRVLVLDEFAASLNGQLESAIRDKLAARLPGTTIVEVTHRLEATGRADAVIAFDRGTATAHTPHTATRGSGTAEHGVACH